MLFMGTVHNRRPEEFAAHGAEERAVLAELRGEGVIRQAFRRIDVRSQSQGGEVADGLAQQGIEQVARDQVGEHRTRLRRSATRRSCRSGQRGRGAQGR